MAKETTMEVRLIDLEPVKEFMEVLTDVAVASKAIANTFDESTIKNSMLANNLIDALDKLDDFMTKRERDRDAGR